MKLQYCCYLVVSQKHLGQLAAVFEAEHFPIEGHLLENDFLQFSAPIERILLTSTEFAAFEGEALKFRQPLERWHGALESIISQHKCCQLGHACHSWQGCQWDPLQSQNLQIGECKYACWKDWHMGLADLKVAKIAHVSS